MMLDFVAKSPMSEERLIDNYIGYQFVLNTTEEVNVGDRFRIGPAGDWFAPPFKHVVGEVVVKHKNEIYGYHTLTCKFVLRETNEPIVDVNEWMAMLCC